MADIKVQVETAQKSKTDGALGISKKEYEALKAEWKNGTHSAESVKWMQHKQPELYNAINANLDYSGYTGTANHTLSHLRDPNELKADAARRDAKLDQLPPLYAGQLGSSGAPSPDAANYGANGLEKVRTKDGGKVERDADHLVGRDENGVEGKAYKNGSNTTIIKPALSISDSEANASRSAQRDYCAKMSGVMGTDVSNPPSANAAKGYFQAMADKGATPAEIRTEYEAYSKTFFRHPGGGSTWEPKLDPRSEGFKDQLKDAPIAKDGKRLVDCETFSAMSEHALGGIKAKDGKPMFEVMHAQSGEHKVTGFFPRGGDARQGFVVDNQTTHTFSSSVVPSDKDWAHTKDPQARERALVRRYMTIDAKHAEPTHYGTTAADMKRPQ